MMNSYMKQLHLAIIYLILFSIEKCLTLNICPTAIWQNNATTIVDSTNLNSPRDVFIGQNNIMYVIDTGNYCVKRFSPNSTIGTIFINGTNGPLFNQLSYFSAVSGDLNGSIYILDRGNTRVTKWTSDGINGIVVAGGNVTGNAANQLNYPSGIFLDVNTLFIWIADTGNSRIVRWESPSTGIIVCGSNGTDSNQFFKPFGLFVNTSDSNTFYVADTYNHRVQMWLSGANNGTTIAGRTGISGSDLSLLYYPTSILGDTNRNIYILNFGTGSIVKWAIGSTSGVLIVGTLSIGVSSNQLYNPYNFKFDSIGSFIVADTSNNRIQNFSIVCTNITSTTRQTTVINNPTSSSSITSRTSISTSTTHFFSSVKISNSSTIILRTTTERVSSISIDYGPRLLLIIFCSIIILMNN
ncbi:unnamed protein product [Adineta steineri]|uniref:NHL repeat containing protein-like protein n=1 Tax=Adineta steineri TaxID=433720 RepID=A0A816BPE1_9BILA|nr:unnamed protein product [Adineta steineri]CAF1612471.1 unnamed protein product [Adineta steineri]